MRSTSRTLVMLSMTAAAALLFGCGRSDTGSERQFISIGTAPVGGVFYTIGGAISDVLNQNSGENNWNVTAESTGGSMENIRRLDGGEIQFAISNSSITYFAVGGEEGWEKAYPVKAVMTLFPNVAMFITKQDSGITSLGDLQGKRVSVGPEGAGFEYFIRPILEEHGVTYDDFEPIYAGQQTSVDYLADGSIDAAFLGGGVPTASITSAAATMDIRLIPYGEQEKQQLIEKYPFFHPATIPANTYKGQTEVFEGLNVGSAHMVVAADVDEELVYQVTKRIYENREALSEKHKAANAITPENAPRYTGTEFHPGAMRYYEEANIWPEASTASSQDE